MNLSAIVNDSALNLKKKNVYQWLSYTSSWLSSSDKTKLGNWMGLEKGWKWIVWCDILGLGYDDEKNYLTKSYLNRGPLVLLIVGDLKL